MASVAARVPNVEHGLRLLPPLAAFGCVAKCPRRVASSSAGTGRQKGFTHGGCDGQPKCQDQSKRGPRGFDAGKKVNGRKRHALVDTLGFYIALLVHPADIQDRDGARLLLSQAKGRAPAEALQKIWADGGYRGELVAWVKKECDWELEIVAKPKEQKGFVVLPKRWIVERTFAWQAGARRLTIDYEENPRHSEAWLFIAQIKLMLRRLKP